MFYNNQQQQQPQYHQSAMASKPKNVLIGCTGSVAAIKLPNIISELKTKDPTVNVSNILIN
jgi:hypothetical protein